MPTLFVYPWPIGCGESWDEMPGAYREDNLVLMPATAIEGLLEASLSMLEMPLGLASFGQKTRPWISRASSIFQFRNGFRFDLKTYLL